MAPGKDDLKMEPKAAPPSPALSNGEIFHGLPGGFNELAPHNIAAPYPRDQLSMEPFQPPSQPTSRYSTPIPQPMVYPQHMGYLGGHFQNYPQHIQPQEISQYGPLPDEIHVASAPPYSTPATSPPTPSRASDIITTRSRAAITRAASMKVLAPKSSRVEKSTPKKKERAKAVKKIPKLDGPMSELTKDSSVDVVDIEAYVHRPTEVRRKEVAEGKIPGKIKRPMNAFMLYRKAYQNRAKTWCSQHNHQVVSQVCGDSWPLEPEHVRLQFNEWAKIERDNHQKAHPGYKFTPSKPQKAKLYRKESEDVEPSEAGDFDWDSRHDGSSRNRSRTKTPMQESDDEYQPPRSTYHQHYAVSGAPRIGVPFQNRSAFHFTNPGKPMPNPYDHRELPGHYYQTTHIRDPQRQPLHGAVEDLMMRKTPSPGGGAFQQPHADPGFEFMGYHQQPQFIEQPHPQQAMSFEHHIDPSLMVPDGLPYDHSTHGYMVNSGHLDPQHGWQPAHMGMTEDNQFAGGLLGLDETLLQERHTQFLKGTEDSWHIEQMEPSQFEKWVDAQPVEE